MFQHEQGKLATFKILMLADILLGGHHEVIPGLPGTWRRSVQEMRQA